MDSRIAFRFLHAGDFQLGRVVEGLPDVPEALRAQLLDAPLTAARRVFDAAVKHQVDFVLLVGELVASGQGCSPQATTFLVDQFDRLNREGIHVFLATESPWPNWAPLPGNVSQVDGAEPVTALTRGQQPAASICCSGLSDIIEKLAGFNILVANSNRLPDPIPAAINYVAIAGIESAGQPLEQTSDSNERTWSSGTPQGRSLRAGGQHGCLIINVDERQTADVRFVNTAPVGWVTEHILVSSADDLTLVAGEINSRSAKLGMSDEHECILVDWILDCEGSINGCLAGDAGCQQLLEQARRIADTGPARIFSIGVRVNEASRMMVNIEPDRALLTDFVELAGRTTRFDSGATELERLPWFSSDLLAADSAIESRVIRYGFDLLG